MRSPLNSAAETPPGASAPRSRRSAILGSALLALLLAAPPTLTALAQSTPNYEPQSGQAGKDVVWVPTSQALVDKMLDLAKVTPQDYLIDLGSGDGRTVITAAQRGLRAHGIEYNPEMVEFAKRKAKEAGVSERATFEKADIFQSDFSKAQVITMFLLSTLNEKLRPTLLKMKPGTRLVSNTFRMGDWEADEVATITNGCTSWCTALLWIVPAQVEGKWSLGNQELTLTQRYQMLTGTLGNAPITDAKMNGAQITFTAGGARYTGTVDGKTMSGKVEGGPGGTFSATQK